MTAEKIMLYAITFALLAFGYMCIKTPQEFRGGIATAIDNCNKSVESISKHMKDIEKITPYTEHTHRYSDGKIQ